MTANTATPGTLPVLITRLPRRVVVRNIWIALMALSAT
jgi:hypothetical protein